MTNRTAQNILSDMQSSRVKLHQKRVRQRPGLCRIVIARALIRCIRALCSAIKWLAPEIAGNRPPPDAELLMLGAQLEKAWAHEKAVQAMAGDEAFEAAVDACSVIVDRIEKSPAHTLAGLRVKAMAFHWARSGEPIDDDIFNGGTTTDLRLAAGVIRDLLAIDADT